MANTKTLNFLDRLVPMRFGDLDVSQSLRMKVFEEWCEEAESKAAGPEAEEAKKG